MFLSEQDLQRIINKETTPEQAKRREETQRRAKTVQIDSGVVMKPGVVKQDS